MNLNAKDRDYLKRLRDGELSDDIIGEMVSQEKENQLFREKHGL